MISRDHILSLLAAFCTCLPSVAGQGAVVHSPKKYGLLDAEGKVISACQWDSAGEFYHGATIVKKEGKVGLLNAKGELFIPCIWDDVRWFFHENRAAVLKDDKMGYIDRSGKVVIKLEWDWCGEFRGNLAEVERDGLYGLIDLSGKVVVKPEWDEIRFDKAYVMCVRDKKILLMNTKAEILHPTMWDKVTIYSDELVAGKKGFESTFLDSKGEVIVDGVIRIGHDRNQLEKYDIFSIQKEEGWGYISREGELQSMPQWDKEILFDKDQAVVSKGGVDHILYRSGKQVAVTDYYVHMLFEGVWLVEDKKTKKMGYMDESFKLIVPCVWGRESREASDGRIVVENEGLFGAINVRGEVIIPAVWDELDSFLTGEPSVVGRNGKYGFVDRNGKLITKLEFDDCCSFRHGYGVGVKGQKSWFIDTHGKLVKQLNGAVIIGDDGYLFYNNGMVGALAKKGKLITPAIWDNIDWLDNGSCVIVEKNELKGLISHDGKVIAPPVWGDIDSFHNDEGHLSRLHWVKKGNKWGLIDANGKLLHEPSWLEIDACMTPVAGWDIDPELTKKENTNEGYVVTDAEGKQGYISAEGELTIPAIYDELYFVGDMGYAKKGMLTGFIHKSGKVISECQWDDYYELSEGVFVVQMALERKEEE